MMAQLYKYTTNYQTIHFNYMNFVICKFCASKTFFFFFCLFSISWATPAAYGDSQARGQIGAVTYGRATQRQREIRAVSATYIDVVLIIMIRGRAEGRNVLEMKTLWRSDGRFIN